MGLSNEERFSGIAYAIDRVMDIVKSFEKHETESYDYPKNLIVHVKKMWHAFIGSTRNSAHWVLGSSATNDVTCYDESLWGVAAINHYTNNALKEDKDNESDVFDAFDGFLDLKGLLSQADRICWRIYDIFAWSEQIIYYLRRYDDAFLRRYEDLSKIISDIQGECFHLFKQSDAYAKAYILTRICKLIYTNKYPYDTENMDSFTRFLVNNHGHHDLSRPMQRDGSIKELAEIHIQLQRAEKAKKLTVMMRVVAFMKISGRRFHYDHNFKALIETLKPKKVDRLVLNALFSECKKAHDDDERQSRENYLDNKGSPLSIYGYDVE